jgi:hypothetical protein
MKKPPAIATAVLIRLGDGNDCIIGDLLEEYSAGRSRLWYWRQVLALVATNTVVQVGTRPLRASVALTAGWATLLLGFTLFGDRTAEALARLFWSWDRASAYAGALPWWPFQISAVLVSYAGFALSAWAVSRVARPFAAPMVLAYAASVMVVLVGTALLLEVLFRRHGGVPVPHPLFYIVSVTLPYQWRSGLVLAPLVIMVCGLGGALRHRRSAAL